MLYEQAPPSTLTGTFDQCWDAAGCLVYVSDPADLSCAFGPCSAGTIGACTPLPAGVGPF